VHWEVIGQDGEKLRSYCSELFEWEIDANNPMGYGTVQRDGNTNPDGVGIGGGMEEVEIGLFNDPERHLVGVVKTASVGE